MNIARYPGRRTRKLHRALEDPVRAGASRDDVKRRVRALLTDLH